ncbi:transketolase [Actinospica durhamensis]|uniref:Transketolase n=1 Tax=Actinospica durhamensis TaxID=1508375 RepID=A0A941IUV9_9ACTN|nr:transketolase [Actinospica durhamensis]MBR7836096.1 transketolase [Actinospica durhamensis]
MISTQAPLDERSLALRRTALASLVATGGGHVGGSFSAMEIMRALYDTVATHDPADPADPGRDRVILSKGHACLAQYTLLADHGYLDPAELATVGKRGSRLGGHPERGLVPGVECSTGALGHGLSLGLGMALQLRRRGSTGRVFVVLGDGELGEGSVWEAAMSASHHRLANLSVLVDLNTLQSAGPTREILDPGSPAARFAAFGWNTAEVDGHDPQALAKTLQAPRAEPERPLAVICHTVKGRGLDLAENVPTWHYRIGFTEPELESLWRSLGADQTAQPDSPVSGSQQEADA